MANWNELFYDQENREKVPEAELYRFVSLLEKHFETTKLKLWDLGCGAGRHTVAMAKLGCDVYASDNADSAISLTENWLKSQKLNANVVLSEMNEFPWEEVQFNGVFSWDVLQHNTIDKIIKTVDLIWEHLLPSGMLLATIKSDKADLFGKGVEIEPKTFVLDSGKEKGVPHHYFNEDELRRLFDNNKWEIKAMTEQVIINVERPKEFWKYTPFRSTTWGVLMQKKVLRKSGE